MTIQPFLYGDRVMLRLVETDDIELLRDWADDPDIRPNLRWTGPIPRGHDTNFAYTVLNRTDSISFVIEADNKAVGCILLTNIETDHGTADISIWLRSAAHGNGYAKEATALVLEHAFNTLRLQRVQALSYEYNTPAHSVLDSLNFTHEGTLRHSVYHDGEYYDCYVYGILNTEFSADQSDN
jgi:RimJ/RimL family protein N-acetyltransferase